MRETIYPCTRQCQVLCDIKLIDRPEPFLRLDRFYPFRVQPAIDRLARFAGGSANA
jgi:hypothetical protein